MSVIGEIRKVHRECNGLKIRHCLYKMSHYGLQFQFNAVLDGQWRTRSTLLWASCLSLGLHLLGPVLIFMRPKIAYKQFQSSNTMFMMMFDTEPTYVPQSLSI